MPRNFLVATALLGGLLSIGPTPLLYAQENPQSFPQSLSQFKEQAKNHDPIEFLLKCEKELALRAPQKDSLKGLHKGLEAAQKPLMKQADKYFETHVPAGGKVAFVVGRQTLGRDGRTTGGPPPGPPSRVPPEPVSSEAVMLLQSQLFVQQDIFKDFARALLTESQIHVADSLRTVEDAKKARDSKQP